jgi:hypothetical protein
VRRQNASRLIGILRAAPSGYFRPVRAQNRQARQIAQKAITGSVGKKLSTASTGTERKQWPALRPLCVRCRRKWHPFTAAQPIREGVRRPQSLPTTPLRRNRSLQCPR